MRGYLLAPECFDEKMVCQQELRHAQPNARARRAIRALGQPGPQLRRRGPAREVAQQAVQVHQVAQAITHVLVAEQLRRAEQDHISHEGAAGLESRALHKPKPAAGAGPFLLGPQIPSSIYGGARWQVQPCPCPGTCEYSTTTE